MKLLRFAVLFALILANQPVSAQPTTAIDNGPVVTTRILFVFDASKSMYGRWQSDMKIHIAQNLLIELLDSLEGVENLELALRVYGHQRPSPPQDCNDTRLEVPFSKNNGDLIKQKLRSIVPKGTTPIAQSLARAVDDFTACANCRNIIILITDGIEECDGDPCAVSQELQRKGIVLKPFVIGIGQGFKEQFDCVGTYFDAGSETQFRAALNVAISQALNSTTAQVNLLDVKGNATETNVSMTFYDHFSGQQKYNFVHTLSSRGVPDTLSIDPLATYRLVVHTIPPVSRDSIILLPGKHTVIPINAGQGTLNLKVAGNQQALNNLDCIIRRDGKMETINVQYFRQKEKYLVGRYDLEVLTIPRLIIQDVDIKQDHTTDVEIPEPGMVTIQRGSTGYGSIFQYDGNELKWVYNLKDNMSQDVLLMQPGTYKVVFRSRYAQRSFYTMEQTFTVSSGTSMKVLLTGN
jgi:Ca-activated chloride channel homolog